MRDDARPGYYGESLVAKISEAISILEGNGYPGPYACVLGSMAFDQAHVPCKDSLVLPADRITPLLAGPLLRCGSMPKGLGVVLPTSGEAIDLVVATPPRAQFLQVDANAKYLFRVYERIVLRIKDPCAVQSLELTSKSASDGNNSSKPKDAPAPAGAGAAG